MKTDRRRRVLWILRTAVVVFLYFAVREYAFRARSLEAVLGLAHGNAAWHGAVAVALLGLRFAVYGMIGGTLVAWPLEELLLRRARRSSATSSPAS